MPTFGMHYLALRRALLAGFGPLGAVALPAQAPALRTLGKPTAELKDAFAGISGVRELRDGRVVVLDKGELRVKLADFTSSLVAKIGREGNGPGEYRMPLKLFALPGDSTAVFDESNGKGNLVILPDGTPGGTLAFGEPGSQAARVGLNGAIDARGRAYRALYGVRSVAGVEVRNDSNGIERSDRVTGRRDTVALYSNKIVSPLWKVVPSGRSDGKLVARSSRGPTPFASVDQWAVAPDGRVAVVSVNPYRVRFVDANGSRRDGPVLPTGRVPVTAALKDQWREQEQRPVPTLMFARDGSSTASMQKRPLVEPEGWPDELPPFLPDALLFAPDGMLWVQRTHAADAPPTCDVIDATGRVAARVALPMHSRLVGFGPKSVYLVRIDDDDLEYLQRYPVPTLR